MADLFDQKMHQKMIQNAVSIDTINRKKIVEDSSPPPSFVCISGRSHLPEDLIAEILSRIQSPKLILRFRCVSKSWLSLINDINFICMHLSHRLLNYNYNNYDMLILHSCHDSPTSNYAFSIYNSKTFDRTISYKLPQSVQSISLHGSCNGLVLIYFNSSCKFKLGNMALVNPVTAELKTIPVEGNPRERSMYGFGYDALENDYKIVRVCEENELLWKRYQVFVYSLSMNSWKKLNIKPPENLGFSVLHLPVVLNGHINWRCHHIYTNDSYITAFDLNKEVFHRIIPPRNCARLGIIYLGELWGHLSVLTGDMKYYEIWIMKDYGVSNSWTKQFKFTDPCTFSPQGFGRDGTLLLTHQDFESAIPLIELIWYDPQAQRATKRLHEIVPLSFRQILFGYVESLAPISPEKSITIKSP